MIIFTLIQTREHFSFFLVKLFSFFFQIFMM